MSSLLSLRRTEPAPGTGAGADAERGAGRRPRVVIVGAGFGGLAAAKGLKGATVDVIVLDRHNYHLFQPLLYQVATASLSPAEIASPIRAILRDSRNTEVLLDEVVGVDVKTQRLITRGDAEVAYDYLVLATGSEYSYFGHQDWPSRAPGLKTLTDATDVRRQVLLAFEQAEACHDEAARGRLLTFVLIGAGPTGVEMAGALAELAKAVLADEFRHIDPKGARILLIEAAPRVLGGFPDKLGQYAKSALERMGVEVLLDTPIEDVADAGVVAKGRFIPAATVIWCAGVKATPAGQWLGVETTKTGTVEVNPDLSVPGLPGVFVLGDAAQVAGPDGRPLPGLAAVAEQEGAYIARLITARAAGAPDPGPFVYRDRGTLATIGRSAAVADFGKVRFTGRLAWLLWGLVHIFLLIGFRNRMLVFVNWMWAWATDSRAARLITGRPRPQR